MKQKYNTKNTISRGGIRNQSTVVPENTQERLSEKSDVSSDSDISSLTKSSYADWTPTAIPVNYHGRISVYPTLYDSNSSSLQSSSSDNSSLGSFSSSVLRSDSSEILSSNNSSSEQVRYPQPTQITQSTRNSRCLGKKCTISGGKQKTKTKRKKQSRKTKKKSNKKKSNKKNIKH